MTVWKYALDLVDHQSVAMPKGARILCAGIQRDALCIWALVDPMAEVEMRNFRIAGTGHEITEAFSYIGTVHQFGGALVWHVFEVTA